MRKFLSILFMLSFCVASYAQVVTAGMTGLIRDRSGKPVNGATVTVVHVPTGTNYTAITSETGRYNLRGMIVGGPYTISAKANGFKTSERSDVETALGNDIDVSLTLEPAPAEVVVLEKFVVQGQANELDATAAGAGNVFTAARLEAKPTTQRSFADMISASPFVAMRSQSSANDREEQHISAVGQNNRYNSIQIDGSRINDQFGLNGHGLASFFNPISLDTLEQLSVQVSPYDVRQAGFTGASINAVTKSGTNQFHGSAYYYFSGDHWAGFRMQGEDVNTRITTGRTVIPKLERITKGATLGGPIWKDHIFFFFNYEKFSRTQAPVISGLPVPDATQMSQITARFAKYSSDSGKNIDWGQLGGSANNTSEDEKYLGKIDWKILDGQRLSVRYSQTKGEVPQFGSFTQTSLTQTATTPALTANGVTALSSNFYSQARQEKNLTASLFSKWSPNFNTELRFGTIQQDQLTPTNAIAPEVDLYGLSGLDRNGRQLNNTAALVAGTDLFRQGNQIFVDTKQYLATGDYFWKNFVFSGGVEREENDFYNLFRQSSYGQVFFASIADFLNDAPARITRNYIDTNRRPIADLSDFASTGIFGQVKWNINSRLSVTAGLRYEFNETKQKPALNQQLLADSGLRNDGTLDGADYFSPRVSFNWAMDEERKTQLRGGGGHFLGRAPWVFFSNSFGNTGVGNFTIANNGAAAGTFTNYLRNFDLNNPIATGTDLPGLRREINFADRGIKLPSVYRANVAIDRQLPFFGAVLTIEAIRTWADNTIFITHENLLPTTKGADGRQRYAGNPQIGATPAQATAARYPNFTDIYRLSNVRAGGSTYVSVGVSRPLTNRNKWGFDMSYTRGHATEAQAFGQTTAGGQWFRNVIFNQSKVEVGTADFETKNRIQLNLARNFEFFKKWRTRASLYYEGRTGNPFSWIYANDLNGDGQSNDAIAVPSGRSDPRFDFSGLSATQLDAMFAFFDSSGLSKFAGSYAPKNSFTQPWVNRLDIHVSQEIPFYFRDVRVELFADWINFGSFVSRHLFNYYEEAFRNTNDVFRRQFIGQATYNAQGLIRPTSFNPDSFIYDNGQSRWRIQVGARLKF